MAQSEIIFSYPVQSTRRCSTEKYENFRVSLPLGTDFLPTAFSLLFATRHLSLGVGTRVWLAEGGEKTEIIFYALTFSLSGDGGQ